MGIEIDYGIKKTPEEYKVNWGCFARCCAAHCFTGSMGEV